ncbi:cytochrome P450 301a1-like 2 [Homarus americanus]|uniref:Cytochrome P450 301a1-like 2 n=1 Tax=Homarus americanus TaxID=6706 RepID=A0A8J5MM90_HOMAM|nr:cytochrome P450 301a1-like 2 [Homarus americanus]
MTSIRGCGKLLLTGLHPRLCLAATALQARGAAEATSAMTQVQPLPASQIPGPRRWPVLRSLPAMYRHRLFEAGHHNTIWEALCEQYGPIFRVDLPRQPPTVFITDADEVSHLLNQTAKNPVKPPTEALRLLRNSDKNKFVPEELGLLVDNGEQWWRVRRLIQPHVMKMNVLHYHLPQMDQLAKKFVERLSGLLNEKHEAPANFLQELNKCFLEGTSLISFDKWIGCMEETTEGKELIDAFQTVLQITVHHQFNALLRIWDWFSTPTYKRLKKAHEVIQQFAEEAINKTLTTIERENISSNMEEVSLLTKLLLTPGLKRTDVYAFLVDFTIAAIDNTSNTVSNTLYCLATNPDIQLKVHQELDEVFNVSVILQPMGMNEKYFPQASQFQPERWLRDQGKNYHSYASLPFGFGTRMCIGRRIAEQEMNIFLCRLLQKYQVEWKDESLNAKGTPVSSSHEALKFTFTERA